MSESTQTPSECPATNLLQEGRRHFICKEYALAVEKLSQACEKLVEKHGEGNAVLADSFYSYGEALLEMARMETPVLGNALKDVPDVIAENAENEEKEVQQEEKDESIDDETKEDIADKVIDALCEAPVMDAEVKCKEGDTDEVLENDKPAEKSSEEAQEVANEEDKNAADQAEKDSERKEVIKSDETENDDKEESKENDENEDNKEKEDGEEKENGENVDENGDENCEDIESEGDENVEGEDNGAENEEQDVGYLQLAWEIIEVARTLFSKKESDPDKEVQVKSQLRIADCHRKLGEVLMERDEWTQAAEELQKCLEIETKFLDHPDRRVAETNFEIGVAFDNAEKVSESADAFQRSATILEDFRKKLISKEDKSSDDDAEIKELESVLEEIKTRIVEVEQKSQQPQVSGDAGASSSNGVTINGFDASGSTTTIGFGGESTGTNGLKHASENGQSVKETQDITHLIRKRPKEADSVESPVKKVRVDATSCEN